jgi:hypothetical protein
MICVFESFVINNMFIKSVYLNCIDIILFNFNDFVVQYRNVNDKNVIVYLLIYRLCMVYKLIKSVVFYFRHI